MDPFGHRYSWNDAKEDGGKKDCSGMRGHGLSCKWDQVGSSTHWRGGGGRGWHLSANTRTQIRPQHQGCNVTSCIFWFHSASMLCEMTHWSGLKLALLDSVWTTKGGIKATLLCGANVESLEKGLFWNWTFQWWFVHHNAQRKTIFINHCVFIQVEQLACPTIWSSLPCWQHSLQEERQSWTVCKEHVQRWMNKISNVYKWLLAKKRCWVYVCCCAVGSTACC